MQYRYERKFFLSEQTADILKRRVKAVMRPDTHSGGAYTVHNLYLDDRYDSFYQQKLIGSLVRDKYRARFYNDDRSFIRLERKHKVGEMSYKESAPLTEDQYGALLLGRMDFTLESDHKVLQTLGTLHRLRGLRPTAVFTYWREAYVYDPGNVRVTFDSRIAELEIAGAADGIGGTFGVLEVKYDRFLPPVISGLLSGLPLVQTEMSKYCFVREKGRSSYAGQTAGTHFQPVSG